MSRHYITAALVAWAVAAGTDTAAAPALPATVEQPRAFGHVLGDVLTQRVMIQPADLPVSAAMLPPADRIGLWLDRRAPRLEADAQGRTWVALDYQVINAPRALIAVTLPPLKLATPSGATMDVPEWPISIGPLTPAHVFAQGDLRPLRPDRTVAALPTAGIERQLHHALAMLAAVLAAWSGWWAWRNWRDARHLPFARAWSQVRRHGEDRAEAWLALHHALNETAGHVVQAATLPRLLGHAPQLLPLRAQLEGFYRQSSARFFAVDAAATDTAAPRFPLREVSRALRDIERRHQR